MNTEGVTASSWMVGIMLAGFAGVLLGPILGLQEFQFTLLLVGSFVAVVIGRMSSLPLTFIGAIAIGIAPATLGQVPARRRPVLDRRRREHPVRR